MAEYKTVHVDVVRPERPASTALGGEVRPPIQERRIVSRLPTKGQLERTAEALYQSRIALTDVVRQVATIDLSRLEIGDRVTLETMRAGCERVLKLWADE